MFKNPEELKYTKTHVWVKEEDGYCVVGLTDYAQDALGDIVFVNVPSVDDAVTAGEVFCDVESVKAVSDVFSPVTGVICEVNEANLSYHLSVLIYKTLLIDAVWLQGIDLYVGILACLSVHGCIHI